MNNLFRRAPSTSRLAREAVFAHLEAWDESEALNTFSRASDVAPPPTAPVTVSTDKAWVRRRLTDTHSRFVGKEAEAKAEALSSGDVGFAVDVSQMTVVARLRSCTHP